MRQQAVIILSLFLCIFHPESSALRSPFPPLTFSPLLPLSIVPSDTILFISSPPMDFSELMKKTPDALIIDVREFFEYRKRRLPGAINVPYYGNVKAVADTLNKKYFLFIYCTSGVRSKWAAKIFYDSGFRKIYSLEGGINAWKKEGYPLDKSRKRK